MNKLLHAQLIRLLKNIRLQSVQSERASLQFLTWAPTFPAAEVRIDWWFTAESRAAHSGLAALLTQSSTEFAECDHETARETVLKSLQRLCMDTRFFEVHEVLLAKKKSLLDCLVLDVSHGAALILLELQAHLRSMMGRCCTVFAISRFIPKSFGIPSQSLHFVSKGDSEYWTSLVREGFCLDDWWSPSAPALLGAARSFALPEGYSSLIVVDASGTRKGTLFTSVLRARMLVAVAFSTASASSRYPYHKSAARSLDFYAQYPHSSDPTQQVSTSSCEPISPYYASEIPIDDECALAICNWYDTLSRCPPSTVMRVERAAHFLNLGMNARDTQAFISFFVALDALLGERGSVESSIVDGVRALGLDSKDVHRVKWLFKLRSDLVHGGSRNVSEWNRYARYLQHFNTNPMLDVQRIAQSILLRAPAHFA